MITCDLGLNAIGNSVTGTGNDYMTYSVSLTENTDYTLDTQSTIRPKSCMVTDAEGFALGVKIYLDGTWKILIPATTSTQTATINLGY